MKKNKTILSGVFGAIVLFIALINRLASGFWDLITLILLGLGALLVVIYFVFNYQDIKNLYRKRAAQYLSNAIIASLLMIIIIVLLNYLFNKYDYRIDLTSRKQFTLAPQTVKVLKNLEKPIYITAFFQSSKKSFVTDVIAEYQHTSDKIKFNFYDPDKNPEAAKTYNIKNYGIVVLETEDRSERIYQLDEQSLTNAIIKVTRKGKKAIYFLTGHGEHSVDNGEARGFSILKSRILELNYQVRALNFASEHSIPDSCVLLIVNGPQSDLYSAELDTVNAYIRRGGKVFFLLDPSPGAGMPSFFEKWGIAVGDNIVLDASGAGRMYNFGPELPLVNNYNTNQPIVKDFNYNTFYGGVRSVTPKSVGIPPEVKVDWLAKTTAQSWGETEYKVEKTKPGERPKLNVKFDKDKDVAGPVTVAAIATITIPDTINYYAKPKTGILVVFGDSDFATNNFAQTPNSTLFLNAVNWLAEEEDLVAVPPKSVEDRRIEMTAKQAKFTLYITVFFIPMMVLIFGLTVYFQRRGL
jgi:ABC-type uncharacterized transport system involved in gliding motility auxiliary subunit